MKKINRNLPFITILFRQMKHILLTATYALFLVASLPASAEDVDDDGDRVTLNYSVFTKHFNKSPEHVDHSNLLNLSFETKYATIWNADRSIIGLAAFKNSFGQSAQFLYVGQRWEWENGIYTKILAGGLFGYRGRFKDKINYNENGVAPAIIPAIGYQYRNVSIEGLLLGNRAVMMAIGMQFDW